MVVTPVEFGVRSGRVHVTQWVGPSLQAVREEASMANKDKGGKSSKKVASKSLKEKRQAKQDKREAKANTRKPL